MNQSSNKYNNAFIQSIIACPSFLNELENVEELNLVNLTKPLVDISCYNKKYATVAYDKDFLENLTSSEQDSFNNSINVLHALLTRFLIKNASAFSEEVDGCETKIQNDELSY